MNVYKELELEINFLKTNSLTLSFMRADALSLKFKCSGLSDFSLVSKFRVFSYQNKTLCFGKTFDADGSDTFTATFTTTETNGYSGEQVLTLQLVGADGSAICSQNVKCYVFESNSTEEDFTESELTALANSTLATINEATDIAQGYAETAQGYAEEAQANAEYVRTAEEQISEYVLDIYGSEYTDSASSVIRFSVEDNYVYKYGTLTTLTIDYISTGLVSMESLIFFSSGSTATVLTYPDYAVIVGSIIVEPNTDYMLICKSGTLELKILNAVSAGSSLVLQCYDSTGSAIDGQYATIQVKIIDSIPTFVPVLL